MSPQFYRMRLVKDGPAVGVRIWHGGSLDPITGEELERPHFWRCAVNGMQVPINEIIPWWGDAGSHDHVPGEPITADLYAYYAKDHAWAKAYAPTDPAANPRKKVDMTQLPPIRW